MDHNNFRHFMDTKNLSSKQDCWAQKLSQYYFQIDYCQGKANATVDALSKFSQRSQDKKNELQAKNGQIFHRLQNSLTNTSLAELSLSFFFFITPAPSFHLWDLRPTTALPFLGWSMRRASL